MPGQGIPGVPVQDNPAALDQGILLVAAQGILEVPVPDIPPAAGRDIPEVSVQDSLPVVDRDNPPAVDQDTQLAVHKVVELAVHNLAEEPHNHAQEAVRAVRKLRLEHRREHPKLRDHQAHRRVGPWLRMWWLRSCSMLLERLE
jgi:hypothetical protein